MYIILPGCMEVLYIILPGCMEVLYIILPGCMEVLYIILPFTIKYDKNSNNKALQLDTNRNKNGH